jgi:HNH endonuclease
MNHREASFEKFWRKTRRRSSLLQKDIYESWNVKFEAMKVMPICVFCDEELNTDTKPEHILLSALGGKMTTKDIVGSSCNGKFGSTIDKAVADQVAILRNMLQLKSGIGKSPPMRRKVKAGSDTFNFKNDGTPKLVTEPFTITPLDGDTFELNITADSIDEIAKYIPHIAARLRWSEEKVLQYIATTATGKSISKRPDTVRFNMLFGGELGIRSFAKSCLVLWATLIGNDEVRSALYEAARTFIIHGDDEFVKNRVHRDSRFLPQVGELKQRFGEFFNLIYVRSDEAGRVIGHFTLYNVMAWQFVLVKSGAKPNLRIGLISNPMDPTTWSDRIADEIDIDFTWLNSPDYSDEFACQRLRTAIQCAQKNDLGRELENIKRAVFEKHGVVDGVAVTDPAIRKSIVGEIEQRVAFHVAGIPYEESVSGEAVAARLRTVRDKPPHQ